MNCFFFSFPFFFFHDSSFQVSWAYLDLINIDVSKNRLVWFSFAANFDAVETLGVFSNFILKFSFLIGPPFGGNMIVCSIQSLRLVMDWSLLVLGMDYESSNGFTPHPSWILQTVNKSKSALHQRWYKRRSGEFWVEFCSEKRIKIF